MAARYLGLSKHGEREGWTMPLISHDTIVLGTAMCCSVLDDMQERYCCRLAARVCTEVLRCRYVQYIHTYRLYESRIGRSSIR
jgi:hypothetical protein